MNALAFHLEASTRMLAGVGHEANDTEAGWRGPRAHDLEYVLCLGHVTLPDRMDWLREKLRWEDDE